MIKMDKVNSTLSMKSRSYFNIIAGILRIHCIQGLGAITITINITLGIGIKISVKDMVRSSHLKENCYFVGFTSKTS